MPSSGYLDLGQHSWPGTTALGPPRFSSKGIGDFKWLFVDSNPSVSSAPNPGAWVTVPYIQTALAARNVTIFGTFRFQIAFKSYAFDFDVVGPSAEVTTFLIAIETCTG